MKDHLWSELRHSQADCQGRGLPMGKLRLVSDGLFMGKLGLVSDGLFMGILGLVGDGLFMGILGLVSDGLFIHKLKFVKCQGWLVQWQIEACL